MPNPVVVATKDSAAAALATYLRRRHRHRVHHSVHPPYHLPVRVDSLLAAPHALPVGRAGQRRPPVGDDVALALALHLPDVLLSLLAPIVEDAVTAGDHAVEDRTEETEDAATEERGPMTEEAEGGRRNKQAGE